MARPCTRCTRYQCLHQVRHNITQYPSYRNHLVRRFSKSGTIRTPQHISSGRLQSRERGRRARIRRDGGMRINQGNHKDYPYEVGAETIRACWLTATAGSSGRIQLIQLCTTQCIEDNLKDLISFSLTRVNLKRIEFAVRAKYLVAVCNIFVERSLLNRDRFTALLHPL